jgi:hypothetical protein
MTGAMRVGLAATAWLLASGALVAQVPAQEFLGVGQCASLLPPNTVCDADALQREYARVATELRTLERYLNDTLLVPDPLPTLWMHNEQLQDLRRQLSALEAHLLRLGVTPSMVRFEALIANTSSNERSHQASFLVDDPIYLFAYFEVGEGVVALDATLQVLDGFSGEVLFAQQGQTSVEPGQPGRLGIQLPAGTVAPGTNALFRASLGVPGGQPITDLVEFAVDEPLPSPFAVTVDSSDGLLSGALPPSAPPPPPAPPPPVPEVGPTFDDLIVTGPDDPDTPPEDEVDTSIDYPLTINVPSQLLAGSTDTFTLEVPAEFEGPFEVSVRDTNAPFVDLTPAALLTYPPDALSGTIQGLACPISEDVILEATVLDSRGRRAVGQARITVDPGIGLIVEAPVTFGDFASPVGAVGPDVRTTDAVLTVSGVARGAGGTLELRAGTGNARQVAVSASGAFTAEVPLQRGEQLVALTWNTSCAGTAGAIARDFEVTRTASFSVTADIASTQLWSELTWSREGDVDLHLLSADGLHVFYSNRSAAGITLDVDNTAGFGPEHIQAETLPPGQYTLYVEYFSGEGPVDYTVDTRLAGFGGFGNSTCAVAVSSPFGDTGVGPCSNDRSSGTLSEVGERRIITTFVISEPTPFPGQ